MNERERRSVVRNGPREASDGDGFGWSDGVAAPRVNDKRTDPVTGERKRFASAILPP